MEIFEQFISDYKDVEMVVIGLGAQLNQKMFNTPEEKNDLLNFYNNHIDKKNYFIITSHQCNLFESSDFNKRRICNPLLIEACDETEEKQWDLYNKWLSATLNRKLMIIELGEDFNRPNIFRWPFENITFINNKAKMYRIHNIFGQIPENIASKATSIELDAKEFLFSLKKYIETEKL